MRYLAVDGVLRALILFGTVMLMADAAQSAGFDCKKAGSAGEKTICGDATLSRLDEIYNRRYRERLAEPDSESVRHAAWNFQADRRQCGSDAACILGGYIAAIWEISSESETDLQGISADNLTGGTVPKASAIPQQVGHCAATTILSVHPRLENGGPVTEDQYDGGTGVDYANDSYQVSYSREEALLRSRPKDRVTMCLVEIDRDCVSDDDSGRLFLVTNRRTKETWVLPNAQHKCGG